MGNQHSQDLFLGILPQDFPGILGCGSAGASPCQLCMCVFLCVFVRVCTRIHRSHTCACVCFCGRQSECVCVCVCVCVSVDEDVVKQEYGVFGGALDGVCVCVCVCVCTCR